MLFAFVFKVLLHSDQITFTNIFSVVFFFFFYSFTVYIQHFSPLVSAAGEL